MAKIYVLVAFYKDDKFKPEKVIGVRSDPDIARRDARLLSDDQSEITQFDTAGMLVGVREFELDEPAFEFLSNGRAFRALRNDWVKEDGTYPDGIEPAEWGRNSAP